MSGAGDSGPENIPHQCSLFGKPYIVSHPKQYLHMHDDFDDSLIGKFLSDDALFSACFDSGLFPQVTPMVFFLTCH